MAEEGEKYIAGDEINLGTGPLDDSEIFDLFPPLESDLLHNIQTWVIYRRMEHLELVSSYAAFQAGQRSHSREAYQEWHTSAVSWLISQKSGARGRLLPPKIVEESQGWQVENIAVDDAVHTVRRALNSGFPLAEIIDHAQTLKERLEATQAQRAEEQDRLLDEAIESSQA